jgi:hypothetical protein
VVVAEVQFYDVVVWLHVSAVVVGFGPTFAFGLYLAFIGKNHPRSIPAVFEAQTLVVRTMTTIGALVILASGIYLAADRWEFSDVFVIVGIVAIVVLMGLAYGFLNPTIAAPRRSPSATSPPRAPVSPNSATSSGRPRRAAASSGRSPG